MEILDYYKRKEQIQDFNLKNRWIKRGIAINPLIWPLVSIGALTTYVAIYHRDGTVVISHGGIECGQGINTKAAPQVCAYTLGIPLEMISGKASNNVIAANAVTTGTSVTGDFVCLVKI